MSNKPAVAPEVVTRLPFATSQGSRLLSMSITIK
jgi:hypothetical protein